MSRSRSCTACVDFQLWTLTESNHPLISDMHLLTLRSLYHHSGGINGIATIWSKDKVNKDITVLCSDDTCEEIHMQTHILVLWPHNWTHIWSAKEQVAMQEMTCASWSRTRPNLRTVAWQWLHFSRWHQLSSY